MAPFIQLNHKAYKRLELQKEKDESFSDVVVRLTAEIGQKEYKLFDTANPLAKRVMELQARPRMHLRRW